jgi:hypothetical protein
MWINGGKFNKFFDKRLGNPKSFLYIYYVMIEKLKPLNVMSTERVSRFFQLQEMINFQIDLTGEANLEIVDELEELVNSLNDEEVDYIFENA